jgi:hypothetical protein
LTATCRKFDANRHLPLGAVWPISLWTTQIEVFIPSLGALLRHRCVRNRSGISIAVYLGCKRLWLRPYENALLAQGEDSMHTSGHSFAVQAGHHATPTAIETTLYDLIAAISEEVDPAEDDLVTATVVHLMNSGRVKFSGDSRNLEVVLD